MGVLSTALLVLFIIICIVIIFLVLLQNEEGDSLGGLFAGGSNSAFGSKSGSVLSKATYIATGLFFAAVFCLALLNKGKSDKGLLDEVKSKQTETSTEWWKSETSELKAEEQKPDIEEATSGDVNSENKENN